MKKNAIVILLGLFSILNANNIDTNDTNNSIKEILNNTVDIINKDINNTKGKILKISNKNKQIVENYIKNKKEAVEENITTTNDKNSSKEVKREMKSNLKKISDIIKVDNTDKNTSITVTNKKIIEKISKLVEKLKNIEATVNKNTELIKNKCDNTLLKKVSVKLIEDIHSIKDRISAIDSNISSIKMSIVKPFQVKPKCVPHKELDLKKSMKVLKGSFKRFKKEHTFTAKKDLKVYPLPELGVKPYTDINITKNTKFQADMFTYAGWIHAKEKGWVKGYLLKPAFLQIKKGNRKHSASPVFDVVSCKTK